MYRVYASATASSGHVVSIRDNDCRSKMSQPPSRPPTSVGQQNRPLELSLSPASLSQQLRRLRQGVGSTGSSATASTTDAELTNLFPSSQRRRRTLPAFKRPFLCLTGPTDHTIPSRTTRVNYSYCCYTHLAQ